MRSAWESCGEFLLARMDARLIVQASSISWIMLWKYTPEGSKIVIASGRKGKEYLCQRRG